MTESPEFMRSSVGVGELRTPCPQYRGFGPSASTVADHG